MSKLMSGVMSSFSYLLENETIEKNTIKGEICREYPLMHPKHFYINAGDLSDPKHTN